MLRAEARRVGIEFQYAGSAWVSYDIQIRVQSVADVQSARVFAGRTAARCIRVRHCALGYNAHSPRKHQRVDTLGTVDCVLEDFRVLGRIRPAN